MVTSHWTKIISLIQTTNLAAQIDMAKLLQPAGIFFLETWYKSCTP